MDSEYLLYGTYNSFLKPIVGLAVIILITSFLVLRSRYARIPIWSVMALAAFIVVASGLVSVDEMSSLIDLDVILFLIGMFTLVGIAESSGALSALALWFISKFKSVRALVIASSLVFGLLAAFAMNDTVALMGPPIAYLISKATGLDPVFMFLLLAFSLTIGSVMTPIGNPQNVLVAEDSGIKAPFITFTHKLAIPTLINLVVTPLILMHLVNTRTARKETTVFIPEEAIRDKKEATVAVVGLSTAIGALLVNDVLQLMGYPHIEKRGSIPFVVAAATYVFTREPRKTLSRVDWGTIVFFMSMFIAMEGVWRSGVLNPLLSTFIKEKHGDFRDVLSIAASSIIISQFISNVPFTKLFIDYMHALGFTGEDVNAWLSLAAFSTVAGNLTFLGAASNIIILEVLESRYSKTISFKDFVKAGSIVTLVNTLIYMPFLAL